MENRKTLFRQQTRRQETPHKERSASASTTPHETGSGYCTFCGASMDKDEQLCTECGNPRAGVVCPHCGTLNFRSFCRECGAPLNELAQEALQKAVSDPRVIHSRTLARELEELKDRIVALLQEDGHEEPGVDGSEGLTEEDLRLLAHYDELFCGAVAPSTTPAVPPIAKPIPRIEHRRKGQVDRDLLKAALDEYQQKKAEMQAALDALLPDPQDPPEIQRNFLCACKQEICSFKREKVRKTMGWVCNLCGYLHHEPSECVQPELGGKWIYRDEEVITRTSQIVTLYI